MTTSPNSRILLDRRYVRVDVILDDLAAAGYDDPYAVDLTSRTVIFAVSPAGVRVILDSLEDVGSALGLR